MKVRLSYHDYQSVENLFKKHFLESDKLWIFGSRADLTKKGGDLDLYVETKETSAEKAVKMKSRFLIDLEEEIGEQKIDVVLNILNLDHDLKIYKIAKETGIRVV